MTLHSKEFHFAGTDGTPIFAYRWSSDAPVRGVLQVAHGMGEHAGRYYAPLIPIIESGIVVYANDHRGHGRTSLGSHGDFGPGGFAALPNDMATLTALARAENPGKKLVILGHSMGSFALQLYLLDHSRAVDGAVLSGSAALDLLAQAGGGGGGGLEAFNAAIENPRTQFDWLSRDPKEVDKYLADPMCGFTIDEASMQSMFATLMRTMDPAALKSIRPDLPLYIFAGDKDPVNGDLAWLIPLVERYRAAGVKDVTTDFYKGGRHEMLNEINRDDVVENLKKWMDRVLQTKA